MSFKNELQNAISELADVRHTEFVWYHARDDFRLDAVIVADVVEAPAALYRIVADHDLAIVVGDFDTQTVLVYPRERFETTFRDTDTAAVAGGQR